MITFWLNPHVQSYINNDVHTDGSIRLSHVLWYKGNYFNDSVYYYGMGIVKIGMNFLTQGYEV